MLELNKSQFHEILCKNNFTIFYFYTPLCGTCKLAKTMIVAVNKILPSLTIHSCNINLMPDVAQKFKIKSVPCLIVFENGEIREEIYAFQTAAHLFKKLSKYK